MKIAWILALALLPVTSNAQAQPKFDVASIRPGGPFTSGFVGVHVEGKRLIAEHTDLMSLVAFAWNVQDFQISGGPAWKEGGMVDGPNRFYVEAKVDGDESPTTEQMRLMLRSLLIERFQLQVRIEKKPFPAWDLVINKGGPKLKPSADDATLSFALDGRKSPRESITATAVTIFRLVNSGWLRLYSGRPVVDKTGLTGKYDFRLEWTSDIANANTELPDFQTALRDQLGLHLQSSTAPLDALTIEQVERPGEN